MERSGMRPGSVVITTKRFVASDAWSCANDYLMFFYVPRKWWSAKAWKLAWHLRRELHKRIMRLAKEHEIIWKIEANPWRS